MSTITLIFGEHTEEHGLSYNDLKKVQEYFNELGANSNLVHLNTNLFEDENKKIKDAYILIIKNGTRYLEIDPDDLLAEQNQLETDKYAFMYGKVVNKRARHNLCFADFNREPNYEKKMGRVYNFSQLFCLNKLRKKLYKLLGKNLLCEGNYYYDIEKTYFEFHGDTERKIAVGIQLGTTFNLYFQWFYQGTPRGKLWKFELEHGDIYMMCEKAIGTDWKIRNEYTLRHAAAKNSKLIGMIE